MLHPLMREGVAYQPTWALCPPTRAVHELEPDMQRAYLPTRLCPRVAACLLTAVGLSIEGKPREAKTALDL